jgi:capsid protein
MIAEIQAGVTTFSQVYGPLGVHWEDAFEELAVQIKRARELGIVAGPAQPQQPQQNATP